MSRKTGEVAVENILEHISEKPWSEYKESDYTIEQWHAACLIHLHDGPPTSKSQCKLPVKTPNGALSRNGVHAAAAALAGARSPLQAPSEQKTKAANALRRYYSQLDETPPDSLKQSAMVIENVLTHFGVKGMRWGVRRKATVGPQEVFISRSRVPGSKRLKAKGGGGRPSTKEALSAREIGQIGKKSGLHALSDQQLNQYARRIQLEQNVARLQYNEKTRGAKFVDQFLGRQGSQLANSAAREAGAKAGRTAVKKAVARGGRAAAIAAA
jgi:hypothetical protein